MLRYAVRRSVLVIRFVLVREAIEHENLAIDQRLLEVFAPLRSGSVPTLIDRICFVRFIHDPALARNPFASHSYRFLNRVARDPAIDKRAGRVATVGIIELRSCFELNEEHRHGLRRVGLRRVTVTLFRSSCVQ